MHGKKLIVQISLNRFHNICCIKRQLYCLPFANWTSAAVAKVTSVPSAGMWILLLVPLNHFSCQLPVHAQITWVQSVSLEHQNPTSLFGTLLQNSSAILFHLLLVFCFCTGRPCSAYNCDINNERRVTGRSRWLIQSSLLLLFDVFDEMQKKTKMWSLNWIQFGS